MNATLNKGGNIRILLVDDDEAFRISLRKILELKGYDVTEAADGIEAQSCMDDLDFDIMIADILMPRSDGFEVLSYLHRHNKNIKVIAISGGGQIIASHYLMLAGNFPLVDAQLEKPFDAGELFDTIERLMESE